MPSKTALAKLLDPKAIEKRNKEFHRMSKKRQRIAIAEDVIAQVRAKKYVAEEGTYVSSSELEGLVYGEVGVDGEEREPLDLQIALLKGAPECNVCGLGAAFCSMARLGDRADMGDAGAPHDKLAPIFGWHQVVLIESAFEGEDFSNGSAELSEKEMKACTRFFEKYEDADKRLSAIFRNVVKNDGTFTP